MKKKNIFQKNNSKKKESIKKNHVLKMPIFLAIASLCTTNANALPQGASVASGSVDIVNNNLGMEIRQTTGKAIINWQQFGIETGERVSFIQPSSSSLILNRITGLDSSLINGKLDANGQVFIINPNGVLVGEGAQINAGGIVASTLGISDKAFMDGNFQFSKISSLPISVKNSGSVTAAEGGYIVFLADEVKNNGNMNAPGGRVLMGAGNQIAIYFAKNSLIGYALDRETANALVENTGNIRAAGGTISLVVKGVDDLSKNAVVNNTGVIEAKTLRNVKGKIELLADSQRGIVKLNGTLDASAPEGPGGTIHASAARVSVSDTAVITTHASNGKTGLLTIRTASGRIGNEPDDIHTETLRKNLSSTNIIVSVHANSQAESGHLVINDAILSNGQNKLVLEADRNVLINAPVNVGTGGLKIRTDANGTSNGMLIFGPSGKLNALHKCREL
jgi:filamentous hemagglutinin family protein